MPEAIACKICGKRRARRACPAVQGDICPICCGTEREVSLSCPLECGYLQEAHRHEKPLPVADEQLSYPDVEVSENFIRRQEELVLFCVYALVQAAVRTPGAIDTDVMAALESLIQTHRTAESGLIYESRPENFVAQGVQRSFTASLEEYQKMKGEREPLSAPRSSDILRTLVFLHRLGQQHQNGRPRGRMFLGLLRQMTPETAPEQPAPSLIL